MTNITIIGGENPVFIKETFEDTIKQFPEENRTIRYGDDIHAEEFFADVSTGSLFSAQRMIIVRNANQAKEGFEKHLLQYLQEPIDSVYLVLEYEKIPTKILTAASKLGNKTATIYDFKKAYAKDLKLYIQRKLSDKEITTSHSCIDLLIHMSGEDIEELSGILSKLIAYLGDRKTLTEQDIHHAVERVQNSNIFDLIDAIYRKDSAKAFQCYRDLINAGESFPAMNAMFLRSAQIMWAVKSSQNGQPPQGFAISPYEWKKYQGYHNTNLRFVSRFVECISEIELESKTKPEFFTQMTFEKFLLTL